MRILTAILLFVAATTWGADVTPITVVLSEDYSRTLNIRLNDRVILNKDVLDQLSNTIKDPKTPVTVFIPEQGRFADWMEIKGLLDKIGCLNVRYFVFSAKHRGMTELELPHDAIDFTLDPPPRSHKEDD
jgi:hypothetical protein